MSYLVAKGCWSIVAKMGYFFSLVVILMVNYYSFKLGICARAKLQDHLSTRHPDFGCESQELYVIETNTNTTRL